MNQLRSRRAAPRSSTFGVSWLDVKLAARMLRKQPGLTLVALFALSIGIPVGLLPLHVLDSLTRPPPVDAGAELVAVHNFDRAALGPDPRPLHDFAGWRDELTSFSELGMWRRDRFNVVTDDGRADPIVGAEVTASMFSMFRVPPLLGRPIVAADESVGAPEVVVIGHDVWQSRFAGDPDVVGRAIRVGGVLHTVVGVMPADFRFPVSDDLWVPFRHDPLAYERAEAPTGRVAGRLAPGISIDAARREIEHLGRRLAADSPDTHGNLEPRVLPYTRALTEIDSTEARVGVVLGQLLAFLLLGLACGNVGILVLARTATRTGELSIRTALGASRGRIVMQLFVESLLLASLAAGFGLIVMDAIARGPDELVAGLPFWVDFGVSPRTAVLAFTLAAASAAIAGIVPALKATGRAVHASMQRASGGGSGIRFGRGYSALIVGEVAVSVWFLAFGWALLPSAIAEPGGLGIDPERYLVASVRIPQIGGDVAGEASGLDFAARVARAHEELVRRLPEELGVGPVAVASALPGTSHASRWIQVEGVPRDPQAPAPAHNVTMARVDVGYFEALEQPVMSGRGFSAADLGEDRSAVIVNTGFVDRVLEGRNPIGRRLRYWTPGQEPGPWSLEIVGVVGPLGTNVVNAEADQAIYEVVAPGELHPVSFAVRAGPEPDRLTPRLRAAVAEIDAGALVEEAMPLDRVPNPDRTVLAWGTILVVLLAGIAVVLAAACLYALMSFTVSERTREIGIRTALGARPANVVSTIARRAFGQLSLGVAIGGGLSAMTLSVFSDQGAGAFLRTSSWPVTVGTISLFVVAVGMLACVKPMLRVLRIRPMEVLKG